MSMETDGATALRELEEHPVVTRKLPGCGPLTYREHAELGEVEARAREGMVPAIQALPEWQDARELVMCLKRAAYVPAVPLLLRLWRDCPVLPVWLAVGQALFAIGTPDAHAALQGAVDRADGFAFGTSIAVASIVVTEPGRAYELLGPLLSDEGLSGPGGRTIAAMILNAFHKQAPALEDEPSRACARLLRDDERWVRRALELRKDSSVAGSARALLGALTREELDAALRRWPDPPMPRSPPYAGRRDFVTRYGAGEHDAVWSDLRNAGSVDDTSLREEATAVAVMTMQRVRQNVERVTERLRAAGYPFAESASPWTPPPRDIGDKIARIEKAAGGPCPVSLHAFWTVVGEVSWMRAHRETPLDEPDEPSPIAEADPLCVYGADTTWFSVEEWLERREHEHAEVVGPLDVILAPDYLHKARISGGAPYEVRLPSDLADPLFRNEEHRLPFVDYLRLCFRLGGFSRSDRVPLDATERALVDSLARGLESF
jgi:hypothetical protein